MGSFKKGSGIITRHHKLRIYPTVTFHMLIKQRFSILNLRFYILCKFPFCNTCNFTYNNFLKNCPKFISAWVASMPFWIGSIFERGAHFTPFENFLKLFSDKTFGLRRKISAIFEHSETDLLIEKDPSNAFADCLSASHKVPKYFEPLPWRPESPLSLFSHQP